MLKVNIAKRAVKFLEEIPAKHAKQLAKKIMALREQPRPQDCKKLQDSGFYRVDSGEYRIIYHFAGELLGILLIGKRNDGEVYRKLDRLI